MPDRQLEQADRQAASAEANKIVNANGDTPLTDWQRFFLKRMDYLVELWRENKVPDDAASRLLSRSIYSCYLDCQEQRVGEKALQRIKSAGIHQETTSETSI